jgi:nucleoside-diphosphate-sugar epimerase
MPPNFYYDQEDLLRNRQQSRDWTWSASRPHFVYDFAPERPHNIVSTIGAWAAMCSEYGLPLDFPGTPGCYSALLEITDATQLARAIVWIASNAKARNQAYNVTDGCQFRWKWLWPRIAAHFSLPVGEVRPLKLAEWMKDKDSVWERVLRRHDLTRNALQDIASWSFADFFLGLDYDNIADTTKIRLHGFHGVVDTGEQILAYLRRYRESRLLP